jgi:adenylate cyclase
MVGLINLGDRAWPVVASTRRLAAIMFTDLVGSTAAAQQNESGALRRQAEQERLLRPLFREHGGREVKSTGDGFLVEFESALRATLCAVEIQRALRERNAREPGDSIPVRIGVHLGDVEERDGDIFGDTVNIAARVVSVTEPGGIRLSEPVYGQVRNKVPFTLEPLGPTSLKGVREPLDLYRVVVPWWAGKPNTAGPRLQRLAVLPLTNISPDPDNEYFADGLTEELITVLSQIKGLRVISRTSVSQYKASTKPVAQIGAELGADTVLEGSVRKAGDQLRITVQLIDARSDEHRWAQTYDRKLENVFAIQADVAERTAGALKVELLGSEREAIHERPTASMEAYEAYLRGVQATEQIAVRADPEVDRQAVAHFERAIRQDPSFAAAYARLANHLVMVMGETRAPGEVVARIRELVAKALELRPDSAEALTARGALAMQIDHDWPRAEADFRRAIALNPSGAHARHQYGHLLFTLLRLEEAEAQLVAAREQDPLSFTPRMLLVLIAAQRGDLEAALTQAKALVEGYPEYPGARWTLASFLALAGRADEVRRTLAPLETATDQLSREARASVLAMVGQPELARAYLADWEAGRLPERFALRYAASMYAHVGDGERALDLLERDAREGDDAMWHVYLHPSFDGVRQDPRFLALLRRQNLPTTLRRPLFRLRSP